MFKTKPIYNKAGEANTVAIVDEYDYQIAIVTDVCPLKTAEWLVDLMNHNVDYTNDKPLQPNGEGAWFLPRR